MIVALVLLTVAAFVSIHLYLQWRAEQERALNGRPLGPLRTAATIGPRQPQPYDWATETDEVEQCT